MPNTHPLTRKQLLTLVILTLVWGMNWPILKIGVTGYPAITFRSISMWIGWPLLGLVLWRMKVPFKVPRNEWKDLVLLATSNMFVWHVLIILAVQDLSSGRAAILGYTMPIFSAVMVSRGLVNLIYGGKKKISWMEIYTGEKAAEPAFSSRLN